MVLLSIIIGIGVLCFLLFWNIYFRDYGVLKVFSDKKWKVVKTFSVFRFRQTLGDINNLYFYSEEEVVAESIVKYNRKLYKVLEVKNCDGVFVGKCLRND